MVTGGF